MKKFVLGTLFIFSAAFGNAAFYNNFSFSEMKQFLSQFITQDDLVFDVGANVGKKTELYVALGAQVVCFEPQAECVHILKKKFKKFSSVKIEPIGLGDIKGSLLLFECPGANTLATFSVDYTHEGRFAQRNCKWQESHEIAIETLDAMIAKYGKPKFCKIDVENFEYQVLLGLSQPIEYLSFECNTECMANTIKCIEHLTNLGYTQFNFAIGERGWFAFQQWVDGQELIQKINDLSTLQDWSEIWGLWGDIYARYK